MDCRNDEVFGRDDVFVSAVITVSRIVCAHDWFMICSVWMVQCRMSVVDTGENIVRRTWRENVPTEDTFVVRTLFYVCSTSRVHYLCYK